MTLDQHFKSGLLSAQALLTASIDPDPDKASRATQLLLKLAAAATDYLESTVPLCLPALKEASKHYPVFPINLSSENGRDTRHKLRLIGMLPVGAHLPFKKLQGAARNDRLWALIDEFYWAHAKTNLELPPIKRSSARIWAKSIVSHYASGPDSNGLLTRLGITGMPEARKKAARRKANTARIYGGISLDTVQGANGTRFFVRRKNSTRGRELSAMEATRFSKLIEKHRTAPTSADKIAEFVDVLEKRLRQRLRF